ncbi:hypothetical protein AURDEDRAFT_110547 [Auricularia subglabra TFB-10046 SS5]|nr:hypothetical protein AURDEDRAFT_110547 [Auricularia subglabra TFB-10046 SS5]
MSRLTYFHKAMPEDIPRPVQLPASPPDTELDHMIPSVQEPIHDPVPETAASRFRRVASTVSYHSTGAPALREQRAAPRPSRWLVVVLPPSSLSKEPAIVGNTLSTSPSGRFGNGILMPLFPTLYGQLTAIAREFGLPSISGVCIYLQMTDSGHTMTPRVSDETWPFLWGHFFDDNAPAPVMGLPISGRIEFDIDVRKALWYHSWIGVQRGDVPIPASVAPSASYHRKRESRSTLFGDDDARSENGLFPLQLASSSRATVVNRPSKLSLLQRNSEQPGANAASRDIILLDSRSPPSEQEVPTSTTKRLSPIPQDEEPVTAKRVEADNRVMQWRMASGTSPHPPSNKTGQISLDPAHMPNSAPETPADGLVVAAAAEDDEEVELNLDDFDWSISSAGPLSCLDSPNWPEPLPSVHLEYRLQGSVPPTPSTATTGWPYDYPDSPYALSIRLPSPDIAHRMLDDAPCTPSTATSWGPASYAGSPVSEYSDYAASLDVGQRATWSRPVTPATATSWGPQDSYPPSPLSTVDYVYTPGIADRSFDVQDDGIRRPQPPASSFPYYDAWTRAPWAFVWPYRNQFQELEETQALPGIRIAALGYPFEAGVYPAPVQDVQVMLPGSHGYPFVHGIYPAVSRASVQVLLDASICYPFIHGIYPARAAQSSTVTVKLASVYPFIQASIYPAVYYNLLEIYPQAPAVGSSSTGILVRLPVEYPLLDIYPAVYPHSLSFIYHPTKDSFDSAGPLPVRLPATYPALTIYASVYPNFDIYPEPSAPHARPERPEQWRISATAELPSLWPTLTIYPATYPHFELYPAVSTKAATQVRAAVARSRKAPVVAPAPVVNAPRLVTHSLSPVPVQLPTHYPWIEESLYPSVYPYNLLCIYPRKEAESIDSVPVASYPFATGIYPAVYPFNLDFIYVPVAHEVEAGPKALSYPFLAGIYPTVYPYNLDLIYMPVPREIETGPKPLSYPFVCGIYPAVYPYNLEYVYMPIAQEVESSLSSLFLSGVYPPVYPHSLASVYPPVRIEADEGLALKWVNCKLQSRYPYIQLYEPVYPNVCPYPNSISLATDAAHPIRPVSPQARRRSGTVSRHRDGKTHAVRGSLSRRISAEGAPPVPAIPAHIRTPSTSPAPSRPSSLTIQTISESRVSRPTRKTHEQLHQRYYHKRAASQGGSLPQPTSLAHVQFFPVAEDLLAFLDRNEFPSPPTARPRRTHEELHRLAFPLGVSSRSPSRSPSEENLVSAGSTRSASRASPTAFSQGHASRRSVVLEKVKQFSPSDDAGSLSRSASSASVGARRVSKLDRSKYPFA